MSALIAELKLFAYLLLVGMWRGECRFCYSQSGRILYLAAVTGQFHNNTLKAKRVFMDRTGIKGFEP